MSTIISKISRGSSRICTMLSDNVGWRSGTLRAVARPASQLMYCTKHLALRTTAARMSAFRASSLDLVDTVYSACSVSVCPHDRSLVATGLYQVVRDEDAPVLNESSPPTKRLGRCLLYRMDASGKLYACSRLTA